MNPDKYREFMLRTVDALELFVGEEMYKNLTTLFNQFSDKYEAMELEAFEYKNKYDKAIFFIEERCGVDSLNSFCDWLEGEDEELDKLYLDGKPEEE